MSKMLSTETSVLNAIDYLISKGKPSPTRGSTPYEYLLEQRIIRNRKLAIHRETIKSVQYTHKQVLSYYKGNKEAWEDTSRY